MLQSLHQGQLLVMQSLQDVVQQQPVMSVEEFLQKVASPRVQPSPLGGGEASAAQEPQPDKEDDILEALDPTPPKPFIFQTDPVAATPQVTPEPSIAVLGMSSSQPKSSAPVPDLPFSQDSPSSITALDLNENAMNSAQDHWQDQDLYFPAF